MTEKEIRRGDIFRVDFGRTENRPIKKSRPALIIQNDAGNRAAPITIVAAIREDAKKGLPIQVALPAGTAGLHKDSVVDCGILATVDKLELGDKIGRLSPAFMAQVDRAIRISLGLP